MNEPLIGRGPNIDTSMIVLLISKYAEPLALSIIECLRKNDGIVEVEVLVVVVMIDFCCCFGMLGIIIPEGPNNRLLSLIVCMFIELVYN